VKLLYEKQQKKTQRKQGGNNMKKSIFTVIVAVLAAAFFMVGNSFAEDQEQNAQENIIGTEGCDWAGTAIISGIVQSSCGTLINDGYVSSTSAHASINNGFYLIQIPAGSGNLTFTAPYHAGDYAFYYNVCGGATYEINKTLSRIGTCPTTTSSTTTSIKSTCN
jgi:hypothetical protein